MLVLTVNRFPFTFFSFSCALTPQPTTPPLPPTCILSSKISPPLHVINSISSVRTLLNGELPRFF